MPFQSPNLLCLAIGFTLQAGATGAVKAIEMSAELAAGTCASPGAPLAGSRERT